MSNQKNIYDFQVGDEVIMFVHCGFVKGKILAIDETHLSGEEACPIETIIGWFSFGGNFGTEKDRTLFHKNACVSMGKNGEFIVVDEGKPNRYI